MPSVNDDSPGTTRAATPRFTPPENAGNQASQPGTPDRWLTTYLTRRMVEAGIDAAVAAPLADDMRPEIVAAFSTLARLDRACEPYGVLNICR
jgi:hypothetical protein